MPTALGCHVGSSLPRRYAHLPRIERERMMTSPDLQRSAKGATLADAIEIAARAHAGQTDKLGGMPYALHPLRVMNRVEGEHAKMAAVLHDVVEDTPVTADDLRRAGFP